MCVGPARESEILTSVRHVELLTVEIRLLWIMIGGKKAKLLEGTIVKMIMEKLVMREKRRMRRWKKITNTAGVR